MRDAYISYRHCSSESGSHMFASSYKALIVILWELGVSSIRLLLYLGNYGRVESWCAFQLSNDLGKIELRRI